MLLFGNLWGRITAFFTAAFAFLANLFAGGCLSVGHSFKNEYEIPENTVPYTQIDTSPKTDWTAKYIWDASDGTEENVWMCFRKTVELSDAPEELTAFISADSRYWLYINGENVVFEGGVKRGPSVEDGYYDSVPIGSYLKPGKNIIAVLVWYWGKDTSYSNTDSGRGGFLFEAGSILSNSGWKVKRHPSYGNDDGGTQPNYRLPESNIYYDASKEPGNWLSPDFDDSLWENATENGTGGCAPWGRLYPRAIPLLKDYGLKDYENSGEYKNRTFAFKKSITLDVPYNAQCTPYLKISAKAGKKIRIMTENTLIGSVSDTYITKDGVQEFEALGWFNGEHITYEIPAGVTVLELKYRETGYDTAFSGIFTCENEKLNVLWQKSLRTLYVTMRDNFMDCPDRERAQWWGDVTNEMAMSMYSLDSNAYLLYQKGVASMLGHIDGGTNVLQTVVPINQDYFELPMQQLAGICGFWTYYLYTGDADFLRTVYDPAVNYVKLWTIGSNGLVEHRPGSWDWMDWGDGADTAAIENAWYYYALSCICSMAKVIGRDVGDISEAMDKIKNSYRSLWTENGYKSGSGKPDDRANALAVLSGLADEKDYDVIAKVLSEVENSSPYMEYYVLEALCRMERYDDALTRMLKRYDGMISYDYSTLWEYWNRVTGTLNHAWSGGPLVIMSKYFAGVRPIKAGYREFIIKPQTTVSNRLNCIVPTIKGYVRMSCVNEDGRLVLDAEVPGETKAYIYVPYEDGETVDCNKTTVYRDGCFIPSGDVCFEGARDGFIVFSVDCAEKTGLHFEAYRL
ncbi:MAG: glycoside hydrolase [Clostridia bacterium]|nr:glycoside hydrolase [Clostridia bacterium]